MLLLCSVNIAVISLYRRSPIVFVFVILVVAPMILLFKRSALPRMLLPPFLLAVPLDLILLSNYSPYSLSFLFLAMYLAFGRAPKRFASPFPCKNLPFTFQFLCSHFGSNLCVHILLLLHNKISSKDLPLDVAPLRLYSKPCLTSLSPLRNV